MTDAAPTTPNEVAELWSAGAPLLYLVSVEETRAVALCHAAAQALGADVAVWSSHRGLEPLAPAARTPLAALEAVAAAARPQLAILLDFQEAFADARLVRALRDLLPRLVMGGHCLAVVAPRLALPEGLAAEVAVVRVPLPDEAALGAVLDGLVTGPAPGWGQGRHRALLAARGLTAAQARRAFSRALGLDPALGPAAVQVILAEKKRALAENLGLELVDAHEAPDDLGGLDSFKAWMAERVLAFLSGARRFGLPPPRGVMLLGVQGCGKSLAAKVVAGQLGAPLLRLDIARVLGAGAGGLSAEESLARALHAAEAIAPVALWIDEIEKGFAGSLAGEGGDSRTARLLGTFSTWLQERRGEVFVVATANDVRRLPPELLRRGRFDEIFFVDLPDPEARRAILAVHLRRAGRDPERFDLAALAGPCDGYSGAELEQVVVGALHRAFALGRDLENADLRRVAQDLVPLLRTYEEEIKALREWARGRARPAGRVEAVLDLFRRVDS